MGKLCGNSRQIKSVTRTSDFRLRFHATFVFYAASDIFIQIGEKSQIPTFQEVINCKARQIWNRERSGNKGFGVICGTTNKSRRGVVILTERINIPFVGGHRCQASMLPPGKLFVPKVSHVDTGSVSCHIHIVGDFIKWNLSWWHARKKFRKLNYRLMQLRITVSCKVQ